jgi:hypothetical protein
MDLLGMKLRLLGYVDVGRAFPIHCIWNQCQLELVFWAELIGASAFWGLLQGALVSALSSNQLDWSSKTSGSEGEPYTNPGKQEQAPD